MLKMGLWENRSRIALSCGGLIASEHILTLSHVQLFYATLHTYLVMQQFSLLKTE